MKKLCFLLILIFTAIVSSHGAEQEGPSNGKAPIAGTQIVPVADPDSTITTTTTSLLQVENPTDQFSRLRRILDNERVRDCTDCATCCGLFTVAFISAATSFIFSLTTTFVMSSSTPFTALKHLTCAVMSVIVFCYTLGILEDQYPFPSNARLRSSFRTPKTSYEEPIPVD